MVALLRSWCVYALYCICCCSLGVMHFMPCLEPLFYCIYTPLAHTFPIPPKSETRCPPVFPRHPPHRMAHPNSFPLTNHCLHPPLLLFRRGRRYTFLRHPFPLLRPHRYREFIYTMKVKSFKETPCCFLITLPVRRLRWMDQLTDGGLRAMTDIEYPCDEAGEYKPGRKVALLLWMVKPL